MNKKLIFLYLVIFILMFSLVSAKSFTIHNASDINQPYFSVNGTTGNVGIGISSPTTLLQILNDKWISAKNYLGTGVVNMFKVNTNDQIELGATLNIGNFEFDPDSGLVTFVDMPVTSTPSAGTTEAYSFKLDGENLMTIYSEADGSGGIQNKRIGIGTIIPQRSFHVIGDILSNATINATGDVCIEGGNCLSEMSSESGNVSGTGLANRAAFWTGSATLSYDGNFTWDNVNKRLGIGTSNPSSKLEVKDGWINASSSSDGNYATLNKDYGLELSRSAAFIANPKVGGYLLLRVSNVSSRDVAAIKMMPNGDIYLAQNGGNIGIGTTTPQNTLNVVGDINATGLIYGNGSQLTGITGSQITNDLNWINATYGNDSYVPYTDRKSTRLNSSHIPLSRMPSSA